MEVEVNEGKKKNHYNQGKGKKDKPAEK